MKTVSRNVTLSGADDSLLLPKTNGILGRLGVLPGFDFDEDNDAAVPSDHIHFTVLGPIAGSYDPVADGADVVDGQKLGSTAEGQEAVKE